MTKNDLVKEVIQEELIHMLTKVQNKEVQAILEWYFKELKRVANLPTKE